MGKSKRIAGKLNYVNTSQPEFGGTEDVYVCPKSIFVLDLGYVVFVKTMKVSNVKGRCYHTSTVSIERSDNALTLEIQLVRVTAK